MVSDVQHLVSAGGIRLALPSDWTAIGEAEHLGAFAGPPADGVRESLVITEEPRTVPPEEWWLLLRLSAAAVVPLGHVEQPDGWTATYAHTAEGVSFACIARVVHLPGRTLVLTVTTGSTELSAREEDLLEILGTLEVEGVSP